MMGVTAHELRHLLRAFDGLDDVDVIVDNTLAGPVLARLRHRHPRRDGGARAAHPPRAGALPRRAAGCRVRGDLAQPGVARRPGADRPRHPPRHPRRGRPVGPGGDAACFVGRMHPSKGLPEAIEAAAIAGIPLRIAAKMQEPAEEEYFEEFVRPAARHERRVPRGARRRREVRADGKLVRAAQPDPVGRAVRTRDDRGDGHRHAGRGDTAGSVGEIVEEGRTGFVRSDARATSPRHSVAPRSSTAAPAARRSRRASVRSGWQRTTSSSSRTCCGRGRGPRERARHARPP